MRTANILFLVHFIVYCLNFSIGNQCLKYCIQISTLLSLASIQKSAVGSRQSVGGSQLSAVRNQQSADGRRQSADGSQQSADGRRQSAVGSQHSADGRRQMAVKNVNVAAKKTF